MVKARRLRYGAARPGAARPGAVRRSRRGWAGQGAFSQGGRGKAWRGMVRPGVSVADRCGEAGLCQSRRVLAVEAGFGQSRYGEVRRSKPGPARPGEARHGAARRGWAVNEVVFYVPGVCPGLLRNRGNSPALTGGHNHG